MPLEVVRNSNIGFVAATVIQLICVRPLLKLFYFEGIFRSLEVIRRLNTGFVAATVFPGFLAFV